MLCWMNWSAVCWGDQPLPPRGAEPVEIPVLVRVSQEFIEELTRDQVTLTMPIRLTIDGIPVTGQGEGTGRPNIELVTSASRAEFTVQVRGSVTARFRADVGPASSHASTAAEFVARKRIYFDGVNFLPEPAEAEACNRTTVDRICSKRGGCLGRVVRRIGWRMVRRQKQEIDRAVRRVTEQMVADAFDQQAQRLIAKLDQIAELDTTVAKYFPETEAWIYHLATREQFLLAGAGPQDAVFPRLPGEHGTQMSALVEVWLRTTPLQSVLIETLLLDWNVAHEALRELLSAEDAQIVGEAITVARRGGWTVIQVGQPAAKNELPAVDD